MVCCVCACGVTGTDLTLFREELDHHDRQITVHHRQQSGCELYGPVALHNWFYYLNFVIENLVLRTENHRVPS